MTERNYTWDYCVFKVKYYRDLAYCRLLGPSNYKQSYLKTTYKNYDKLLKMLYNENSKVNTWWIIRYFMKEHSYDSLIALALHCNISRTQRGRIVKYIERNWDSEFTIENLIKVPGLTKKHLEKLTARLLSLKLKN